MSQRGDEKSGWRKASDMATPSASDVEAMLSPWLNGRRVRDVQLLAGGLMNRNCRVCIDDATRSVVLRLYDHDSAACAKEVAVLELLRREVPVPEVLYAERTARAGRPAFVVLEFVDGLSLRDLTLSGDPGAIAQAAYDAGRLLGRLQTHHFPRTGLLSPALTVDSTFLAGPLTTVGLIERFATSPSFQGRVDPCLLDRLLHLANEWDERPDAPHVGATLVHGDFNSRNVLVRRHAQTWSVAAILDWEFAFAGLVYCDIGNFLRYERAAQPRFEPFFSRGCRDGGVDLRGNWLIAARLADLPALCDLLARPSTPDDVATEVLGLVTATVDGRDSR
jgi:aminoglycoside phosphotransferase (APT) family kinase protein